MTDRERKELDLLIDRLIDLRQRIGEDIDIIVDTEFRIRIERILFLLPDEEEIPDEDETEARP